MQIRVQAKRPADKAGSGVRHGEPVTFGVPLPRGASSPRALSVRASDFAADPGVLPTADELAAAGGCVVTIRGARHNDMHDGGPAALRNAIAAHIVRFLEHGTCDGGADPQP